MFFSIFYGYTQEYLPILHYVFQEYSLELVKYLLSNKYELSSKSDSEFVECVYKVCNITILYYLFWRRQTDIYYSIAILKTD